MNENKANFAKIGFFVLSGFALIVIVIGIAGARVFNKQVVLAETYFTESVTGLDIGSPVKYRGVPVGTVSRIGFVSSEYGRQAGSERTLESANQILVVMALDPNKFTPLKNHNATRFFERRVKDGMRVKLAAAGVTGLSFLELDYGRADQKPVPPPPITWQPNTPYIPSSPSTMFVFKQAMDDVFVKLNGVDIQALGDKLLSTLSLIQEQLHDADIAKLSLEATSLLSEFRETNRGLKELVCSPELAKLPANVGETVSSARRIATSVETQLPSLLQSIRSVTERANLLAESLTGIATNSGGQVQQTVAALSQTAQTLNRTALSQQSALTELIQNLRNASAGLDQIVSDLHTTPSALLFSTPPDPLPETRGKP